MSTGSTGQIYWGVDYASGPDYTVCVVVRSGNPITNGTEQTVTLVDCPCSNNYPPPEHTPKHKPPLGKRKSYRQTQRDLPKFLK